MTPEDLRAARKRLGLTQAEMAKALGLSRDFIGQMERGVADIAPRTAAAVQHLLGSRHPPGVSQPDFIIKGADGQPLAVIQAKMKTTDPLEQMVELALIRAGLPYVTDMGGQNPSGLDFLLTDTDGRIEIEVKRFHTDRIAKQMAKADNVIAVQGEQAVRFFASLLAQAPQRAS